MKPILFQDVDLFLLVLLTSWLKFFYKWRTTQVFRFKVYSGIFEYCLSSHLWGLLLDICWDFFFVPTSLSHIFYIISGLLSGWISQDSILGAENSLFNCLAPEVYITFVWPWKRPAKAIPQTKKKLVKNSLLTTKKVPWFILNYTSKRQMWSGFIFNNIFTPGVI